jgi:hypothetical protein
VAKLHEHEQALAAGLKPRSYRRLKDALADAKDGDRILMLRGIHNFSGETCEVHKRVLIKVPWGNLGYGARTVYAVCVRCDAMRCRRRWVRRGGRVGGGCRGRASYGR